MEYEGEYSNGKKHGKGKEYVGKLQYEGEFLNGKRHGRGKIYNNKGEIIFDGEFSNGYEVWFFMSLYLKIINKINKIE